MVPAHCSDQQAEPNLANLGYATVLSGSLLGCVMGVSRSLAGRATEAEPHRRIERQPFGCNVFAIVMTDAKAVVIKPITRSLQALWVNYRAAFVQPVPRPALAAPPSGLSAPSIAGPKPPLLDCRAPDRLLGRARPEGQQ